MSFATPVFPVQVWDGTSRTHTRYDDASPDYVTGDQYVAEIIATQEVVLEHIDLVSPLKNIGVSGSVLSSDGLGLTYRSLVAGANVTITINGDGDFEIAATGGGGSDTGLLKQDGTRPLTADWDVGSFRLTNLADPTGDTDAATRGWAANGWGSSDVVVLASAHNYTDDQIITANAYTDSQIAALTLADFPLSADHDFGDFQIRAKQFFADIVTGTAPIVVNSTTVCANLNADQVDGHNADEFAGVLTAAGVINFSSTSGGSGGTPKAYTINTLAHKGIIRRTTTQTLAHATATKILFGTSEVNVGSVVDIANSRITIQRAGKYLLFAFGYCTLGTSNLQNDIRVNGANITSMVHTDAADSFAFVPCMTVADLAIGDNVEFYMNQSNTGSATRDLVIGGRSATLGVLELP